MRATAVISSKGQIVIPAKLRKRYGMNEGSTVVFQEDNGRLVLSSGKYDELLALMGSLRDYPLEEDLERERQAERLREDLR